LTGGGANTIMAGMTNADEIGLNEVEAIKAMIERALPAEVHTTLQQARLGLTLGSSRHAAASVVVDPDLADELAETELLEEMVSYRKNVTGIDHTVFISPKGRVRHAPRIKVAINPPDSLDPSGDSAAVAISDGAVVAGTVDPALLAQLRQFIELNRQALLDYWEYRTDAAQLQQRLRPIPGR
jgi:hypothetical protein